MTLELASGDWRYYAARLSDAEPIPEFNPLVLTKFHQLCQEVGGDMLRFNELVYIHDADDFGSMFSYDPCSESIEMPMSVWVSHVYSRLDLPRMVTQVPEWLDGLAKITGMADATAVATEGFQLPYATDTACTDKYCAYLQSPIAYFPGNQTWEEWFQTLKKERRDKIKAARKQPTVWTVLRQVDLSAELMEWYKVKQAERFAAIDEVDDTIFGLSQFFWSVASGSVLDNVCWLVTRDASSNQIKSIAHFLLRDDTYYFYGVAHDSSNNIGIHTLTNMAEWLVSTRQTAKLDPTCRTVPWADTIDTYKRVIVNQNKANPILLCTLLDETEKATPPFFSVDKWYLMPNGKINFTGGDV